MRRLSALLVALFTLGLTTLVAVPSASANPSLGGDRPAAVALTTSFELLALTVAPLKDVVPDAPVDAASAEQHQAAPAPTSVRAAEPRTDRAASVIVAGNGIDEDALARWGFWLVTILAALGLAATLLERSKRSGHVHNRHRAAH